MSDDASLVPAKPGAEQKPKKKAPKPFKRADVERLIKRVVEAMALTIGGDAEGAKKETQAIIKEVRAL